MVRLALATAMRQGELLNLEWRNIDLTRKVAKLEDTKNGDRREGPLFPAALVVLEAMPPNMPPARSRSHTAHHAHASPYIDEAKPKYTAK